jgi:hypothetical protein
LPDVSRLHFNSAENSNKAWESTFRKNEWFRRGWTLQEPIAPALVDFFCKEGELLGNENMFSDVHPSLRWIPGLDVSQATYHRQAALVEPESQFQGQDFEMLDMEQFGLPTNEFKGRPKESALYDTGHLHHHLANEPQPRPNYEGTDHQIMHQQYQPNDGPLSSNNNSHWNSNVNSQYCDQSLGYPHSIIPASGGSNQTSSQPASSLDKSDNINPGVKNSHY